MAGPVGRPKGTGSQRIYDVVRRRILSLEMPPGSGIDENALVAEFRISRTPVREALIRLATDGYVILMPNRRASVSPLDIAEIPELLEAAELCLRVTSRWAALRRTETDLALMHQHQQALAEATRAEDYLAMSEANSALHLAVALAGRNRHMVALYKAILPQYHRLTVALLSSAPRWMNQHKKYFSDIHDEHEQLIAAIERGDSAAADRLAQAHARLIGNRLEAYVWSGFADNVPLEDPAARPATAAHPERRAARAGDRSARERPARGARRAAS